MEYMNYKQVVVSFPHPTESKEISETYLVDAPTCAMAEEMVREELDMIPDLSIKSITNLKYHSVYLNEVMGEEEGHFYKVRLVIDQSLEYPDKVAKVYSLVRADNVEEVSRIIRMHESALVRILSVVETPIVEILKVA